MTTFILLLFIASLAAVGTFLFFSYNLKLVEAQNRTPQKVKQATSKLATNEAPSRNQWSSVKLHPGLICCKDVEVMRNKVFLAAEAPQFPLAYCNERDCSCRYVHLADRRDNSDRRYTTEYQSQKFDSQQKNKRKTRTRRAIDKEI